MSKTHYHTIATLVKPNGNGIHIDGMIVEYKDLSQNKLFLTFKFQADSYNFDKIVNLSKFYNIANLSDVDDKLRLHIDGERFYVDKMIVVERNILFEMSRV